MIYTRGSVIKPVFHDLIKQDLEQHKTVNRLIKYYEDQLTRCLESNTINQHEVNFYRKAIFSINHNKIKF